MLNKDKEFAQLSIAYGEMFPGEDILSPDMLKQKYATNDYIMSVYRQCLNNKKVFWDVVPKEHLVEYPPDVLI